jgi:sarcosine oxidase subunit alpha
MLRDDGFVLDDGTVARLAGDRYVLTTTTANAGRVMQHLDHARQVLWPVLDVQAVSVTEQWAQYAVAGPQSRALLQAVFPALDLSDAAFPFMAAAAATWGCGPARLFRISFSGERAYEAAVPAHHGDAFLRALMAAGAAHGVTPYGTEALGVLRIEKGHPAGGELNGQTSAHDLGLGRMLSSKKDFIGRLMAARPALTDPARPRLVWLKPVDPAAELRCGAHLLPLGAPLSARHDEGHVTSACFSPVLGQWIGLGLVAHGPERIGERVRAVSPVRGVDIEVELCPPVFVDAEGARVRG